MKNGNSGNGGKGKKVGGAVGAVAVLALLGLFGSGKLGFGNGFGLNFGDAAETAKQADTAVEAPAETEPADAEGIAEAEQVVEIRVQGREYNYANVTYGGAEHPLDELLEALADVDRGTRVELVVEDTATKNAVDEIKAALAGAGFVNVWAGE